MAARLEEIAKQCGVSKGTVSRVLNDYQKGFSVRAELRDRILATAAALNYQPHITARSLKAHKTHLIAIVGFGRPGGAPGIDRSITQHMLPAVHEAGYDLCWCMPSPQHRNRQLPPWKIDGAVIFRGYSEQLQEELKRGNVPHLSVNIKNPPSGASVIFDEVSGMQQALEALYERGHRRIAYLNIDLERNSEHYSVHERHASYLRFMSDRGLTPTPGHDRFDLSTDAFVQKIVPASAPTAVVAYDHFRAVNLYQSAYRFNLRIPQQLSVICFNDEFPITHMWPPISTVALPTRKAGSQVGQMIVKLVEGRLKRHTYSLPERLVLRESVAALEQTG